jgi:hypothetical protein
MKYDIVKLSIYLGDWHRYNLKRKVANLSSVTADEFETRKASHETKVNLICKIKRKDNIGNL